MITNLQEKGEVKDILLRVVDEMLEGILIFDSNWKYLYVNETMARQGKISKEQMLGHTLSECFPSFVGTPAFAKISECMSNRTSTRFENEFIYPDKSTGWFLLCVHPVKDGMLLLTMDITVQKQQELALKEKIHEVDVLMNSTTSRELKLVELKSEIAKLKQLAEKQSV